MWNWDSRTHQFISFNAILRCASFLQKMIKFYHPYFTLGIEAPDNLFKDTTNHYYNCTPNEFGYNSGCVHKKISSVNEDILSVLDREKNYIHHNNCDVFLSGLLDNPIKVLVFEMGVISHYIADSYQPLHTDGKFRFAEEETVHKIYEADVRKNLSSLRVSFFRRKRISNLEDFFLEEIHQTNNYYDQLIENYYLDKGKVKQTRWEDSLELTSNLISSAIHKVSSVFLSYEDFLDSIREEFKFFELVDKIENKLDKFSSFYLRKYPSGSILVKRK